MIRKSLFVFRRDLRLDDNLGLNAALDASDEVVPVFIVDPMLLERWQQADRRLAFLYQSVVALQRDIEAAGGHLLLAEGDPASEVSRIAIRHGAEAVFVNREYSPLGRERDEAIAMSCEHSGIAFQSYDDLLLNPPAAVLKGNGDPYVMFTPYYRKAAEIPVPPPQDRANDRFAELSEASGSEDVERIAGWLQADTGVFTPGSSGAGECLARLADLGDYSDQRDIPASGQTSGLSAHLRFGTCSPRQVYHEASSVLGNDHPLLRQLYWRDFYYQVAWYYPHVYQGAFRREYDAIRWQDNDESFRKWCDGQTGFPIVDAGMRELLATGYMHNRVRMIVASFLTKNLHISWQRGEEHFAQHLVDYDPAVNNGNWQWGASTGCDAQPYFRVFNPWRQQQKFDRDCVYIKRWVPELDPYPAKAIHGLEKKGDFYLPRITDLKASAELSKSVFREASGRR